VDNQHDTLHADATSVQSWERFRFIDQGDATCTIQTHSGFFSGVNPNIGQTFGGMTTAITDPNNPGPDPANPGSSFVVKFELMMILL
jgi:hypothetical protein